MDTIPRVEFDNQFPIKKYLAWIWNIGGPDSTKIIFFLHINPKTMYIFPPWTSRLYYSLNIYWRFVPRGNCGCRISDVDFGCRSEHCPFFLGRNYPAAPHLCHAERRQLRNPEKRRTERLHAWLSCQPLDSRSSLAKRRDSFVAEHHHTRHASPYSPGGVLFKKLKKSHACMHASHASHPGAVSIWF